jgi:N-acetylmuramoyl-L-alanine amidase
MKIFINPGHGAKVPDSAGNPPSPPPVDPGAVGLAKYEEATVNLAIANKLMTKLSG